MNNNTYILVWLFVWQSESWTRRSEVQVFTKTEMCRKFRVTDRSSRLTVSHDRVFVVSYDVIAVYKLNGIRVGSFGKGTLRVVRDIAAGSDSQIFVLNHVPNCDVKIVHVFTKDGHQQNSLRVNSKEVDYFGLASYPSGEHIVFSGFERKTRRLKVAMYRKDGVFNRSVILRERLSKDEEWNHVYGIAVTNDGSVAISFCNQNDQRKVTVRPMKPC